MRRSLILAMAASLTFAAGATVYLASSASAATACASAWSATAVYVGGNSASQNGHNYTAKWWTQNESPATHSGQWDVWADNGACGGTTPPTSPPTTAPPTTPPTTQPTTPPPTTPPPATGIPKHALIGYLHSSFANGSGYIRMADVPADWDIIDLAFGE